MAQPYISDQSMKWAVEIAVAGMPMAASSLIYAPDKVADFIEIVAKKIEMLRTPKP